MYTILFSLLFPFLFPQKKSIHIGRFFSLSLFLRFSCLPAINTVLFSPFFPISFDCLQFYVTKSTTKALFFVHTAQNYLNFFCIFFFATL